MEADDFSSARKGARDCGFDPIDGAGHFERDDVLPIDETAEAIAE